MKCNQIKRPQEKLLSKRAPFLFLVRTVVYIAIAAFVQQARCSQLESFTSDVQAIVSVVHPEKSGAATLQLSGQLSAFTDAPIYAQTSG